MHMHGFSMWFTGEWAWLAAQTISEELHIQSISRTHTYLDHILLWGSGQQTRTRFITRGVQVCPWVELWWDQVLWLSAKRCEACGKWMEMRESLGRSLFNLWPYFVIFVGLVHELNSSIASKDSDLDMLHHSSILSTWAPYACLYSRTGL